MADNDCNHGKEDPLVWADDRRMTRQEACDYARAFGLRIAVNTLAKKIQSGGGPPFERFNGRVYYKVDAFRAWLLKQQS